MTSRHFRTFRYGLCFLGLFMALPILALTALAWATPITLSGRFYLLGGWLVATGLIIAPWWRRWRMVLILGGAATLCLTAGVRLHLTLTQTSPVHVIVAPDAQATRWINSLIDEEDSLLFGEKILYILGGASAREDAHIAAAIAAAYTQGGPSASAFASPVLSTYLGLQSPSAFDLIIIEPKVQRPASVGIVFLHGYMGNVVIQCWQIAQAVNTFGAVTICPSTDRIGDWWTPVGAAIVRTTLAYLRKRGVERIYLGGFSNGGCGVGELISPLADEPNLRGLFFIAGTCNGTAVRSAHLPVLIVQGRADERMPVENARRFASDLGPLAKYVEIDADHFLIMKQPDRVQAAIRDWMAAQMQN